MAPSIYEDESNRTIIPDGKNAFFTVTGKQITVLALPGGQSGHISKDVSDDKAIPVTTNPHRIGPYSIGNGTIHWEK